MLGQFKQHIQRLIRTQEGIAYLEFALALPVLLTMFLGAVEVTRYVLVAQKVEKISVTMSDLVAQSSTMSSNELDVLVQAAGQVMQPYNFKPDGYVIVSSVTKTGTAQPVVSWQYRGGGDWVQPSKVGTQGGAATLPSGFSMVDKDNVIIAEIYYRFTPLMGNMVGNVISGSTLYRHAIFKPRLGDLKVLSFFVQPHLGGAS
ncbi:MAG: TadE/TadG family type IV pilus assembly protein [Rickettsiales bacterium]|nr:TadE/TadG family type IV pilus assembly protein [Rickettsiales bacterium]